MHVYYKKHLSYLSILCLALTACSSGAKKEVREPASASNQLIDPSTGVASVGHPSDYVIDAGSYSEAADEASVLKSGGKSGLFIPTEKFISQDRQKNAPVGKLFYVFTDEQNPHCIKSKFVTIQGKKVLLTYPNNSLPTNYCVYQKNFAENGQGFTLSLKDGPTCRPSYSVIKTDNERRRIASIEQISNVVPISYCLDNTVSYGEVKTQGSQR